MKSKMSNWGKKKEARAKLNSKLVKKFGFEQKFLIKEVLDSILTKAKTHELGSLKILGMRSETEIKKRLMVKQTAVSQKKKLNFLNGKKNFNERNAENEQAKGKETQVEIQICFDE